MAQRGINKVILVGRLGQDPEIRYTPSGDAVANLTLATSEVWKDKQGQQQERTEWHRIVMFGNLAEIAGKYLVKGSQIYVEGKLQTRKWQDQNGQDRYSTEVVLQGFDGVMQMLSSGDNQQAAAKQNKPAQKPQKNPYEKQKPPTEHAHDEPPMDFDDDIPF